MQKRKRKLLLHLAQSSTLKLKRNGDRAVLHANGTEVIGTNRKLLPAFSFDADPEIREELRGVINGAQA